MSGRIPQAFIDDLLARINIIDVLDGRVAKLKRSGKNFSGLCPFHKEKTPSFSANAEKQFYYCFGCGAGGNAIGFLMDYEHFSFPEAIETLAQMAGVPLPEPEQYNDNKRPKQLKNLHDHLEAAASFYQKQLRHHPQHQIAIDYLKQRGLTGQIAKTYQIGFAPDGWDNLIQHLELSKNSSGLKELEEAGLVIHNEEKERFYDRFRNRIIFPIKDPRGRVIAFGGRVLGEDKPKYLNSPETELFHKGRELYGLYEARQLNSKLTKLLIVEGYMDVISLAQYGVNYAVATLGTAATEQHLQRLFRVVDELIFCFDGDQAGRTAALRALNTSLPLIEDNQQIRFLFLPDGDDPDTLIRNEGKEAFEQRVHQALPLSEFFFRSQQSDELFSMDDRARFHARVQPLIQNMKAKMLQQLMLDRVEEITGLSPQQFAPQEQTYEEYPIQTEPYYPDNQVYLDYSEPRVEKRSLPQQKRMIELSEYICALLLRYPELAKQTQLPTDVDKLRERFIPLLIQLHQYFQRSQNSNIGCLYIDWQEDPKLSDLLPLIEQISQTTASKQENNELNILQEALHRLEQRIATEKPLQPSKNAKEAQKLLEQLRKIKSSRRN